MRDEKLIEAMGKIEDSFILEADEDPAGRNAERNLYPMRRKKIWSRMIKSAAAACLLLSLILPNVSEHTAYALQAIPGLGRYFQLITLRKYSFQDGKHSAEVSTPYLSAGEALQDKEDGAVPEQNASASAEKINTDIEKKTEELVQDFKEELAKTEYKNLDVSYKVLLDSEDYYVLVLSALSQEGDSSTLNHYYTVDKHSGNLLTLKALFPDTPDYEKILTEEVRRQIQEHNQKSSEKYFLQDGEDSEGFREVHADQSFYINENNQLVLVFPEGEVAPMYMGEQQFLIPESIWHKTS